MHQAQMQVIGLTPNPLQQCFPIIGVGMRNIAASRITLSRITATCDGFKP